MRARILAALPLSCLVAACGSLPTLDSGNAQAGRVDPATIELGTEPPGDGAQRLDRMRGYAEGACGGPRADAHRATARSDLRDRAAAEGAQYIQLVGVGPMDQRGQCQSDVYRVTGIAYGEAAGNEPANEQGQAEANPEPEDSSERSQASQTPANPDGTDTTADKLAELEALREDDLISEQEYHQLRKEVLDEAF